MSSSAPRQRRTGAGILALSGAVCMACVGLILAATLSNDQPLAPAIVGGGAALCSLALGRWGFRALSRTDHRGHA